MIPLDQRISVSGQISAGEVADLAAGGVTLIVNNRPDGEEAGQPPGAEIARAAQAVGVGYRHIPVAGQIRPEAIEAMAEALDAAEGKVLAYCRSGTRSTYLWALARASRGAEFDELASHAAEAGYDLTALRPYLARMQGSGGRPPGRRHEPSDGSG